MQANNIISAGRFGAYFKKHLVDNYRFYGMSLVVLTGLLLFLTTIVLLTGSHIDRVSELIPFYLIGMFIVGGIFTSMSFSELGNKPRGIDYLLFPASHLEKFLSTWLVTFVGFLLVYNLSFSFAIVMGDAITAARIGSHIKNDLVSYTEHNSWWLYAFYFWTVTQSLFLLGAIYTQKYSFIKTVFFFIVFVFALYLINTLFVAILLGSNMEDWKHQFPFVGANVIVKTDYKILVSGHDQASVRFLVLPKGLIDVLLFAGKYLVAPFLWVVAYFRLRDVEM